MGEVEPRKQQGKWRNFTALSVKLRLVIIITPQKGFHFRGSQSERPLPMTSWENGDPDFENRRK